MTAWRYGDEHPRTASWSDFAPWSRVLIVFAALVQLGLMGAALTDLRGRRAAELNGPGWMWALVSLVNVVGPITYFVTGRRRGRTLGTG